MTVSNGTKFILYCVAGDEPALRETLYRVPAEHIAEPPNPELDGEAIRQLANLVGDNHPVVMQAKAHSGTRLFVGPNQSDYSDLGPALLLAAHMWQSEKEDWKSWIERVGRDEFEDCPHGFEDCVPFAKLNYTADLWYVITAGPHLGEIGYWSLDPPFEGKHQIYADSLDSMIERICTESDYDGENGIPICFTLSDYSPASSLDEVPDGTECLYAVRCEQIK